MYNGWPQIFDQSPFLLTKNSFRELGCHTKVLTKDELQYAYPWINVDGIEGAVLGTQREGW